ncbi:hypothetical protein [Dongia sp. agr-C8]
MLSSTRNARRTGLAAATLLAGLALGWAARADNIPPSALEADLKSCVAACVGSGKPAEKCTAFCSCSAKAYGEQLTLEEYLAINNAISKGEVPPQAAVEKMKAITKTCKPQIE